ncbi:hypothetical protein [Sorangium sp. So ce1024]|uniref:hypothetical protein n=1 Tax=Sorangium sp. So ce1024 TaxID=3133327 RepID=UPI003F0F2C99
MAIEINLTDEEKKKKAELEAKHGVTCYLLRGGGVDSWAKEPSMADIDAFMFDTTNAITKGKAMIELFCRNLAEGSRESVFGKRHGAVVAHSNAYAEAVGITADALLGK